MAATLARVTITRRVLGYAYPRNGNVHNPTPRVVWEVRVDGRFVGNGRTRTEARQIAKGEA